MRGIRRTPTLGTLAALAAAAFAVWLFVELADDVMEGETRRFDESVLLAFREDADSDDPVGPRWLEEMARDVTALGGTIVLTFATIAVTGFFLLQRKWHLAIYVAAAVVTGLIASSLLKWGFDRPRPDLVDHGQVVYTASFPSGHSMLSAIAFLTLGALVAGGTPLAMSIARANVSGAIIAACPLPRHRQGRHGGRISAPPACR